MTRAVLAEHAPQHLLGRDALRRGARGALPRAMEESGVALNWVFTGDEDIQLINAKPDLSRRPARHRADLPGRDGHTVTYVIVPGGSVILPERGRVQIDRWRPVVQRENGFSLILWRQQGCSA